MQQPSVISNFHPVRMPQRWARSFHASDTTSGQTQLVFPPSTPPTQTHSNSKQPNSDCSGFTSAQVSQHRPQATTFTVGCVRVQPSSLRFWAEKFSGAGHSVRHLEVSRTFLSSRACFHLSCPLSVCEVDRRVEGIVSTIRYLWLPELWG